VGAGDEVRDFVSFGRGELESHLSQFKCTMPEVFLELLAGSIAGGVGMLIGHPLDTLKARMQMNPRVWVWSALTFH
jgi:hypothetical protein